MARRKTPKNVTPLQDINGILPYIGWDFIPECCGWNSIVGPWLVAPCIVPSPAVERHGHGGMQYFSSVFTTQYLRGLDGMYITN